MIHAATQVKQNGVSSLALKLLPTTPCCSCQRSLHLLSISPPSPHHLQLLLRRLTLQNTVVRLILHAITDQSQYIYCKLLEHQDIKEKKKKKTEKIFHCIITSRFFVANEPEVYSGKKNK